jgi:hypothetical protein
MQLVAPAANYTKTFRDRYDHPPDIVAIYTHAVWIALNGLEHGSSGIGFGWVLGLECSSLKWIGLMRARLGQSM